MKAHPSSILIHGKPKLAGTVRVPLDLAPESWEAPQAVGLQSPSHRVCFKEYQPSRANMPQGVAFHQVNPCGRGAEDQAMFQHTAKQAIYFLHRGKLHKRWITDIDALVEVQGHDDHTPGDETYLTGRGYWTITYSTRR